jgi:hypothetical protein
MKSCGLKPPHGPTIDRDISCIWCGAPLHGRELAAGCQWNFIIKKHQPTILKQSSDALRKPNAGREYSIVVEYAMVRKSRAG